MKIQRLSEAILSPNQKAAERTLGGSVIGLEPQGIFLLIIVANRLMPSSIWASVANEKLTRIVF